MDFKLWAGLLIISREPWASRCHGKLIVSLSLKPTVNISCASTARRLLSLFLLLWGSLSHGSIRLIHYCIKQILVISFSLFYTYILLTCMIAGKHSSPHTPLNIKPSPNFASNQKVQTIRARSTNKKSNDGTWLKHVDAYTTFFWIHSRCQFNIGNKDLQITHTINQTSIIIEPECNEESGIIIGMRFLPAKLKLFEHSRV